MGQRFDVVYERAEATGHTNCTQYENVMKIRWVVNIRTVVYSRREGKPIKGMWEQDHWLLRIAKKCFLSL